LYGWITKKDKTEAKKRRVFGILRDSVLDCFEDEQSAAAALKQKGVNESGVDLRPPRSFDLWLAVVTMTPESHKRVFAVYPEGEQQPFLLQCKDAANFKEWFTAISDAAGANAAPADDAAATRVFGAPLHVVMNRQGRRPPVPAVMAATVEYLETHALRVPRLFFVEPSEASQQKADKVRICVSVCVP
jgi:hypothetical protein